MKLSICQKFISELISSTVLQLPIFVANLIANYDDGNTTFETTISEEMFCEWYFQQVILPSNSLDVSASKCEFYKQHGSDVFMIRRKLISDVRFARMDRYTKQKKYNTTRRLYGRVFYDLCSTENVDDPTTTTKYLVDLLNTIDDDNNLACVAMHKSTASMKSALLLRWDFMCICPCGCSCKKRTCKCNQVVSRTKLRLKNKLCKCHCMYNCVCTNH